ncbi:MAG: hypothetical protein ABSC64_02980 [Candidatus Korobacteraceae bacterium]|jgi:hypothetical protein
MSHPGSDGSPFNDGFAALWHEPALLAAELTWRWCFGFAAWALSIISCGLFLDSIKISPADEFLLGTFQPQLLSEAVQHIFRGSLTRFVLEQSVLLLGVTLLWCFAATVGRAATLCRLVAMFSVDDEPSQMTWQFVPIFVLHLLRAAWSLIAVSVAIAGLIIGGVMAGKDRAGLAALWLVFGTGLACWFGATLNWFFGVAPLFCIRNGASAMDALARSVDFVSRRGGRLFLLGLGFLPLRLVWFGTMTLAMFAPLSLARHLAVGWVLLIMAAIALLYCAGADLLHLACLGAYASLAEDDAHPVPAPQAGPPSGPVLAAEPDQPAEIAPAVDQA